MPGTSYTVAPASALLTVPTPTTVRRSKREERQRLRLATIDRANRELLAFAATTAGGTTTDESEATATTGGKTQKVKKVVSFAAELPRRHDPDSETAHGALEVPGEKARNEDDEEEESLEDDHRAEIRADADGGRGGVDVIIEKGTDEKDVVQGLAESEAGTDEKETSKPAVPRFVLRCGKRSVLDAKLLEPKAGLHLDPSRRILAARDLLKLPSESTDDYAGGAGERTDGEADQAADNEIKGSTILFGPTDVTRSPAAFTKPLAEQKPAAKTQTFPLDHEANPTRTLSTASKNHKEDRAEPAAGSRRRGFSKRRLMLQPEQINRLVQALANSPLLQKHVSRQWWEDVPDHEGYAEGSEATPSLTDGSSVTRLSIYSQTNQMGLGDGRSPSGRDTTLDDHTIFPGSLAEMPVKPAPNLSIQFGGIAIADPKVHGAPVKYVSKDYWIEGKILQVGACSFLNIPYGASVHSMLRIEPPSKRSATCRIMLQIVNQLLERKSGKRSSLLVAEVDVTGSFIDAALAELSAHADIPLEDIHRLKTAPRAEEKDEQFDWCSLADELQGVMDVKNVIEGAASAFAALRSETCSMQTLTLMSELERWKTQRQDLLIVRATGRYGNGMVSGMQVQWVSQHLHRVLLDIDEDRERSEAARLLRERVVAEVTACCMQTAPFDSRIFWGDQMRHVHVVPLLDGDDREANTWVTFLSGESSHLPFCWF